MSKLTDVVGAIHHLRLALEENHLTLSAIEIEEDLRGLNLLIDDTDKVMFVHNPLYAKHGTEILGVKIKRAAQKA